MSILVSKCVTGGTSSDISLTKTNRQNNCFYKHHNKEIYDEIITLETSEDRGIHTYAVCYVLRVRITGSGPALTIGQNIALCMFFQKTHTVPVNPTHLHF